MDPAVLEAMLPWFRECCSGTGAVHSGGVEVRAALDQAREKVAAFLNAASPEEIIFTSSGTESINLAVKGCALASRRRGKKIVLSSIEHPATLQSVEYLETLGFEATRVPVSNEGKIDPAAIKAAIDDETILICVHAGHHDIGVIQDLNEISQIEGPALFVDATYAAGWMPLDVRALNAGFVAVAPHRFGGPKGVGILYKQRRSALTPLFHGGAQELGWRAGTENIPGIVGTGAACETFKPGNVAELQSRMWAGLRDFEGLRLNGPPPGPHRLPNSLNISLTGLEGEGLALHLDIKGFRITSGQACATKAGKIPSVLAALNVPEAHAQGTVILSFGKENTADEVDLFLQAFPKAVERLREL